MHASGNRPEPVEVLMSDHQTVLGKLDRLEQIFLRLERETTSPGDEDMAFFQELTTIFDTELVVHFDREEKVLFPVMEKYVSRDMGPVGVMLEEHVTIFKIIDRFVKGVNVLGRPGKSEESTVEELIFDGRSIIELLRGHIDKEDNVLLPAAESHLSNEDWVRVQEGMEAITIETVEPRR